MCPSFGELFPEGGKLKAEGRGKGNNNPAASSLIGDAMGLHDYVPVNIWEFKGLGRLHNIFKRLAVNIRRIPDNHVEPAPVHDAVELHEPVKRLVAVPPLLVSRFVVGFDAVVAGQIFVQFVPQIIKPFSQIRLCAGECAGVHAALGLHGAELMKGAVGEFGLFFNASQLFLVFRVQHSALTADRHREGFPDFVQRRKTHQRVAGADVEVDVWQRFDLVVAVQLRDEFEEQAQFADFYRLFHDVHAVQVVDDDGLEDEVAFAGVLFDLFQDLAEVAEFFRTVLAR